MKLVAVGPDSLWNELKTDTQDIEWIRVSNVADFSLHKDAQAFFNLESNAGEDKYPSDLAVIFINSVVKPLSEIKGSQNMIRLNGWKGFLKRNTWEVSGNIEPSAEKILTAIGKKIIKVPDEPGFISARILAMIINEAYFAKKENVSSEAEIDIAMKLGTNYPKGPFEWANEIGKGNIYELLNKLKDSDLRYQPAALLQTESLLPL